MHILFDMKNLPETYNDFEFIPFIIYPYYDNRLSILYFNVSICIIVTRERNNSINHILWYG